MRRYRVLLVILGLACTKAPARTPDAFPTVFTATSAVYPGATWAHANSPEAAGYSSDRLDSVRTILGTTTTTGIIVVVGGRVIFEHGDLAQLSYLASARKSILSMLFGNYVASGRVRLDKTLAELGLDDIGGLTPQEKQATIEDLLSARSGVYHAASNPGDNLADAPPRGSQKHGAYYLYSNWDFNALGTIFEQETGRNIYDAFDSDVASIIGMQDWKRDIQRKSGDSTRSRHPAYHFVLSTRDMARVGYLMLRDGRWNDRQVIPRDWVRRSTRLVTPAAQMNPAPLRSAHMGYGYLWWVWDHRDSTGVFDGAYSARGAYGQYITVIPQLDMVIAHKVAVPPDRASVDMPVYDQILDAIVAARITRPIGR
ncbi:MAG TPA: serine hydrolase [Gemmatimonadaceae bacterium]|nr:serine hydrolase [Gemmatimonadaceae bacterium]